MGEFTQRRLIRKLDLERFLNGLAAQPSPKAHLEQYTTSTAVAANLLYLASYNNIDIIDREVLDLGCGTGRLSLGAVFMGAKSAIGIDIDRSAIETAKENTSKSGFKAKVDLILGGLDAVCGIFDTVVMNPPFGVQNPQADRVFLIKALEVGKTVYSLHSHPKVDVHLVKRLKAQEALLRVEPSPFLERFIAKHGGRVVEVYAMVMTIPHMFEFHTKKCYDFVVDLYIIRKQGS